MFKISSELCEETGIFIGDGSLSKVGNTFVIKYAGNATEDEEYFTVYLPKLLKIAYNVSPNLALEKKHGVCRVYFNSKDVGNFKHNVLGFPIGEKSKTVRIPSKILESTDKNIKALLRGYFDTDGYVHFGKKRREMPYYPKISMRSVSTNLIKQCEQLLKKFGFNYYVAYDMPNGACNKFRINRLEISGKDNFEKWFKEIGSNNDRNITKYKVWKKYGYCPSNTSIKQRKQMLGRNVLPLAGVGR